MKTNPFRDFFYFSQSDRRAIVALGCIAVFAIGVQMLVDAWERKEGQSESPVAMEQKNGITPPTSEKCLHSFDPNTVDSLTLIGFGLKAWKVKNFLHYRAAGKVFRSATDMGNTYGWTEEDVAMLEPYVVVGEIYSKKEVKRGKEWGKRERKEEEHERVSNKFHALTQVDVNTADTALLRRIPGIGEKISDAIVRYRQRLGGFHSVNQLLEIKIVSPELLEWFTVSPAAVQKIHLNKASFQALNSHPYISYEQTKALLQYIRLYGEVKDEEMLLSTGIFTKEDLERLRPYITYE